MLFHFPSPLCEPLEVYDREVRARFSEEATLVLAHMANGI